MSNDSKVNGNKQVENRYFNPGIEAGRTYTKDQVMEILNLGSKKFYDLINNHRLIPLGGRTKHYYGENIIKSLARQSMAELTNGEAETWEW